jgi:CRP/FNR family transcriptional regulator
MKIKLKNIIIFKDLDDKTLDIIEEFTTSIKLFKDNILFYEGENSKYLHLLVSGVIKLYKISSHNKEIVLKYFHPNELIAEVANFEDMPYPATAKAFTDIEVLKIDFPKLKKIIYSNSNLSFIMQTSLIKKIKNLEYVISRHLVLDAKERVAQYIYDNPKDFFETKNIEIAEILNIAPETFSRLLGNFKTKNLIDKKTKRIDKEGLAKIFNSNLD